MHTHTHIQQLVTIIKEVVVNLRKKLKVIKVVRVGKEGCMNDVNRVLICVILKKTKNC